MSKLLAFEIRKLFRSKSFWICLLVLSLIITFSLFTVAHLTETKTGEVEFGENNQGVVLSVEGAQEYTGKYVLVSSISGQLPLMLSVFIALFVASDFSQGIVKNILVKSYSRSSIAISKVLATIIAALIFSIVCMSVACGVGTAIWGFGGIVDVKLIAILSVQLVLGCSLACFYMMISMIARKPGTAIAISVVSMSVLDMIISFLENVIGSSSIKEYHLSNMLSNISSLNVTWDMLLQVFCMSILYIFLFSVISVLHFRKVDIS